MDVVNEKTWLDCDGESYSNKDIKREILTYNNLGGKVYVGSDSMLMTHKCNFVAVIAFHDRDLNVAKYFFKKFKEDSSNYRVLQVKILKEVEIAIQAARFVLDICPDAEIELHIDIGLRKRNKTAKFFNMVNGWVSGAGFELRVKPHGWASSLADSHTKGERKKHGLKNKKKK